MSTKVRNYEDFPKFECSDYFYKAVKDAYNSFGLIHRNTKHEFEYYYERPYAYELYHQFRKIQEQCVVSCENPIYLSAETVKNCYENCPDLVFHKNKYKAENNCINKDGQFWACEIKMFKGNHTNIKNIKIDFGKFNLYLSDYGFAYCIFLLVSADERELITVCSNIDNSIVNKEQFKQIICVCINNKKKIYANTLDKIIPGS